MRSRSISRFVRVDFSLASATASRFPKYMLSSYDNGFAIMRSSALTVVAHFSRLCCLVIQDFYIFIGRVNK